MYNNDYETYHYYYNHCYYYQIVAAVERKGWCDTIQGLWNGLQKEWDTWIDIGERERERDWQPTPHTSRHWWTHLWHWWTHLCVHHEDRTTQHFKKNPPWECVCVSEWLGECVCVSVCFLPYIQDLLSILQCQQQSQTARESPSHCSHKGTHSSF